MRYDVHMYDLHAVVSVLGCDWTTTVARMSSPTWLERKAAMCGFSDVQVSGERFYETKVIRARRNVATTTLIICTEILSPFLDRETGVATSDWKSTALGFEHLFYIDGTSEVAATEEGCQIATHARVACLSPAATLAKPFIVGMLSDQLQAEVDFIRQDLNDCGSFLRSI